ncbi:MAG: Gfo/Idh/MocA family protein [Geminicoccaceae bacterium]
MALKLVQLGLGGWGRSWVQEVVREVPDIEPVAWVDVDATSREIATAELGLPPERVFGSLQDVPERLGAEAALVVVPLAAHATATRAALEAELHVLVEKPFTETLAEAAELVALADARGRKLMVNQNYRWFPAPRLVRELLAKQAIGTAMGCYVDFHLLFDQSYRYFFLAEPLLSDMAIHHFDTMRFVLDDEPVEVSCQSWTEPASPFQGRPAAVATIRFARGPVVSYRGSWLSRGPTTPYGGNWRIDGTTGSVEFSFRGAYATRETRDAVMLHLPGNPPTQASLPDLPLKDRKGALDAFRRWIADGGVVPEKPLSTGVDNLRSLALMFAAIRSAQEDGLPVRVADLLAELR